MKYTDKTKFMSRLKQLYPNDTGGWFYNCLKTAFGCDSFDISSRAKIQTLIKRTQSIPCITRTAYPLFAFTDGIAGWKNISTRHKQSPLKISDKNELDNLISNHIYFRDKNRLEDNYHITSKKFEWFAIFCHHGDWHFYASKEIIRKAKASWKKDCQARKRSRGAKPST